MRARACVRVHACVSVSMLGGGGGGGGGAMSDNNFL